MALICRDSETGEDLLPPLNLYLNPEDGFDERCVEIHGITPKAVENQPTFPMVWKVVKKYFDDATIVGHNVIGADVDAFMLEHAKAFDEGLKKETADKQFRFCILKQTLNGLLKRATKRNPSVEKC